jgi:hypothetical protein
MRLHIEEKALLVVRNVLHRENSLSYLQESSGCRDLHVGFGPLLTWPFLIQVGCMVVFLLGIFFYLVIYDTSSIREPPKVS